MNDKEDMGEILNDLNSVVHAITVLLLFGLHMAWQ